MKKLLACLFMVMALQTAAFADAETDMHQMYISKIQAQDVKYSTYSFFNAISSSPSEAATYSSFSLLPHP